MRQKVKTWLHGLIGGAIGGGANAFVASLGIAGADAIGVQVKTLDYQQMVAIFVTGFVVSIMFYLKQSPLPPPSNGDTELINKN